MNVLPRTLVLATACIVAIALVVLFRACAQHASECSATPSYHDAATTESAEREAMQHAITAAVPNLTIDDVAGRLLIVRDHDQNGQRFLTSGPGRRPGPADLLRNAWHRTYNAAHHTHDDAPTIVRVDNARGVEIAISVPPCTMP